MSKRHREPPPTASATDRIDAASASMPLSFVYGLLFLPLNVYIYVGSTDEFEVREGDHFSYRGNARRVTIVFAQRWFQPLKKFFQLDKLWVGSVEDKAELRAIEQYFMNKYDTRLKHRSREPTLSKDLDLMDEQTSPRQLNINRACTDEMLVAAAGARVQHDLQLVVVPTEREQMAVRHMTDYLWCAAAASEHAVPVLLQELVAKYHAADGAYRISVAEVHGDLVRVRNASTEDDGSDFHWLLKSELVKFSTDRNADGTWPPRMIEGVFIALGEAQGLDFRTPRVSASTTHDGKRPCHVCAATDTAKEIADMQKKIEDMSVQMGARGVFDRNICLLGDIAGGYKSAYHEMSDTVVMLLTEYTSTMLQLKDVAKGSTQDGIAEEMGAVHSKYRESKVRDTILRSEITDMVAELQHARGARRFAPSDACRPTANSHCKTNSSIH